MTFTVPEEIEALRKTLRQFASNEVIPLEREHNLSWDVPPPKDLRKQVRRRSRELGLYGADMPVEVGGGGISSSASCRETRCGFAIRVVVIATGIRKHRDDRKQLQEARFRNRQRRAHSQHRFHSRLESTHVRAATVDGRPIVVSARSTT
jgi:hypothetical protein